MQSSGMAIDVMRNKKYRPRAKKKQLKNGVAMLDFEECGYGRKKRKAKRKMQ